MTIKNLGKIFNPKSVAVIGASTVLGKVGNTVLRNLLESGFEGDVFPIHPQASQVEGRTAYASIAATPSTPDLAIVCTPASTVPQLVRECGIAGTRGMIVLSAGFREMNQQGKELELAVADAARAFPGLRIIGPNCLGVMSPWANLNAGFAKGMPQRGRVAFISQSGALCTAVLDWANGEGVGFSHFVSVGNMLDVGFGDLIDYFDQDGFTDAIVLYIESIQDARKFLSAARSFSRHKPIIACKSGRFSESAHAAASHTGAMAGVDDVYQAAFTRAGIVRVFDIEEMFDSVELLAKHRPIGSGRLAIVTNAGGPGVMATDALLQQKGSLAELSSGTLAHLNEQLPPAWSRRNPIDILGDAPPERLETTLETVLKDQQVDATLVLLSPQAMTNPTACAEAVVKAARGHSKPILTAWMGGRSMQAGIELLDAAGIPTYATPERAIRAFMNSVFYHRLRDSLFETPHEFLPAMHAELAAARDVLDLALREHRTLLDAQEAKKVLEAYGIPCAQSIFAADEETTADVARQIGYPIAMKLVSPEITHKTDVGGVALNLTSDEAVRASFRQIRDQLKRVRPDAHFAGVAVQPMISDPSGHELIIGAKRDPVFGTVVMVGAGGVTSEVLRDRALEFPPLNERLIMHMLGSLRVWPLLQGYRGRPGIAIDRLCEILMRVSYLVSDHPEIVELDINPLFATPHRAIALDARMVVAPYSSSQPRSRYPHLAIRPYPSEYVRTTPLKDQRLVTLRPIKPEDEPKWIAMIERCSADSLRSRFGCLFDTHYHQLASQFCFIDYDREITIVAEVPDEGGTAKIIGIGRIAVDADRRNAECALLVEDAWQGQGVGSALLDHCLELCRQWGVERITGETSANNARMLHLFRTHGFEIAYQQELALVRKQL